MNIKDKYKNLIESFKTSGIYEFITDTKFYLEKYKHLSMLFIIATCSISMMLVPLFNTQNTINHKNTQTEHISDDEKNILYFPIYVTISGEVNNPGMYELTESSRLNDLIEKAGGLTENAYTENINYSQILTDEQFIKILSKSEVNKNVSNYDENTIFLDVININTSTSEELCKLPNIGEITAKNIIEYREKNGKFQKIDDIKKVNGIGEGTYNKIKNNICI